MDIETARRVAQAGFRSVSHLGDLLPVLEAALPVAEYERYRDHIGMLIYGVMSGTVDAAIAEHPALRDEIDKSIAATGRYH